MRRSGSRGSSYRPYRRCYRNRRRLKRGVRMVIGKRRCRGYSRRRVASRWHKSWRRQRGRRLAYPQYRLNRRLKKWNKINLNIQNQVPCSSIGIPVVYFFCESKEKRALFKKYTRKQKKITGTGSLNVPLLPRSVCRTVISSELVDGTAIWVRILTNILLLHCYNKFKIYLIILITFCAACCWRCCRTVGPSSPGTEETGIGILDGILAPLAIKI